MAQWRKVIVSGSTAVLNQISASGNIVPKADNGSDLGSSTLEWKDLYIDGTAYLDTVDIDAGDIDGAAIGANSHTTIKGTTIDATTDFTIDGLVITADDITNDAGLEIQTAAGDITLDPGGNNVLPGSDSADDLGASGTAWAKLWVDDIDLAGQGSISMGGTAGRIDLDADDDTSIRSAADDVITFEAGGVDILEINATSISGSSISTGSFGHLIGDGSGLTGVAQDIDLLDAYGAATLHQTQDLFHLSDNGTEKSITFSNLEDSIFANVSGDVLIAAGGAATIQANSVALGTDTTGNYVLDVTVGTGLGGAVASEGGTAALSLDAGQTVFTSIYNTSLIVGSEASQEYITFGTANEVNTFIDNSEVLSVRSGGVDITGVAIVSSDLTVGGNLDVNGTVTTIDSANTYITDKFMIMASGSSSDTDGGILVQNAAGAGYALGYDSGVDRWAFDADLAHNATDLGPDAYVGVVETGTGDGDSQAVPIYGGTTNGVGTIYVDTDDSEIWIYA